jgi:two-component system, NarL family, sensor histidine kinase UhpB
VSTSLRQRLLISITLVFLAMLLPGSLIVYWHALHEVEVELRAALAVGTQTVHNALDDVEEAETPERQLRLLVADFDGNRHLRVALIGPHGEVLYRSTPLVPADPPPDWFYRMLAPRALGTGLSLPEPFNRYGTMQLQADAHNEISEVWDDVVLTLTILVVFCGLNVALVYWVTGRALRPLQTISSAFDRLGEGHYRLHIPESGPRELAQVSRGLNRLAAQLGHAESQRLRLEQQLTEVQEEERAELARDLHDEIGPLLFAVGADLSVIQHDETIRDTPLQARVGAVRESIARIYQDIKSILGRLRTNGSPLELGLAQAVHNLLAFWRARYPAVSFECCVTEEDFGDAIDNVLYHIIMESLSNALRHGNPTALSVHVAVENHEVIARICDDGRGFSAPPLAGGFGIASMEQRARTVGGAVSVRQNDHGQGIIVTARLPVTCAEEEATGTTVSDLSVS